MELLNFNLNPLLRELLVNYCLINYEENAIIEDRYLIMEYHLLERNNELHRLFEAENLNNYLNDGNEFGG
jgi:hypothetical protein